MTLQLANIAAHMAKRELVTFGNLCKQTRHIASRYLFACLSLGRLNINKMQKCFETLDRNQFSHIRRVSVNVDISLFRDRAQEPMRIKWLEILLGFIGRKLKLLVIRADFTGWVIEMVPESPNRLESLVILAQATDKYSLILDFPQWQEYERARTYFWTIFYQPILSPLPSERVESLKLVGFDSHFGKDGGHGQDAEYDTIDFESASGIESDLINILRTRSSLTSLHLKRCSLSTYFHTPYAFNLAKLELDFENMEGCQHYATHIVALSLIRSNRETLQDLRLRFCPIDWYNKDGTIEMPALKRLGVVCFEGEIKDLPVNSLNCPSLRTLSIEEAFLSSDACTILTHTLKSLPRLRHIEMERCGTYDNDWEHLTDFFGACSSRDVHLKFAWPESAYDVDGYDVWEDYYVFERIQNRVIKVALQMNPGYNEGGMPCYVMRSLEHVRLSFAFSSSEITKQDSHLYGLPSDHPFDFLENLVSPMLEMLEVQFSSPFIDYLQSFAQFIGSGRFTTNFPLCKTITGSITTDTLNVWEYNARSRQKTMAPWLKERFIKACKEYHIDVTHLAWQNSKLIT